MLWFLGLLILLSILAAAFIAVSWIKQPKRTWWVPGCLIVLLFIFSGVTYISFGRGEHILYSEDDVALRQIAQLLESTMPLPAELQQQISQELMQQRSRSGAQPAVWLMEGQLAMLQHNYFAAKLAYKKAYYFDPKDEDIAVSYAQAWYLADQQQVSPEFEQFLAVLKKKYPEQTGLINLLAVIAYKNEDYSQAIRYWQRLLPQYPANSEEALTLKSAISNAQMRENDE